MTGKIVTQQFIAQKSLDYARAAMVANDPVEKAIMGALHDLAHHTFWRNRGASIPVIAWGAR